MQKTDSATTATTSRLGSDRDAAAVLKVGSRTFKDLISAPWMVKPIMLGPRLRRWDLDELMAAVRANARGERAKEPAGLRRARIERLKAGAAGQPEPALDRGAETTTGTQEAS